MAHERDGVSAVGYVPGYVNDVFISYAHNDDETYDESEKGWVERFVGELSVRLLKRLGEKAQVWRDESRLQGGAKLDPALEDAIRGSAVLITLLSPSYVNSEYCAREIEWFHSEAGASPIGLSIGNQTRVLPVLLYNLPEHRWPEPVQGTLAVRFHDAAEDELGDPVPAGAAGYRELLKSVVKPLGTLLSRMREEARPARREKPGSQFRVFLAHTAEKLGPARRQLARKLGEENIEVVAGIPPPDDEKGHREAVREAVGSVDLSVHLLGSRPGEAFDDDRPEKTYPLEQVKLGREHAQSQLILMPDDFDADFVDAEFYADFLRELTGQDRETDRLEIVQTGRRQMLETVLEKRRTIEETRRIAAMTDAGADLTAFVDLHSDDMSNVTDLIGYLAGAKITPFAIPDSDLSPREGMSLFERHLRKARLFLVVFGAVARDWVAQRLSEATKLIIANRLATKIGVYVAPPKKQPDDVLFGPYEVAVNTDHFDASTLEPLLAKVRGVTR
jgi:hypothetical protein